MSTRRETSFKMSTETGEKRVFTILSAITPDDLVRVAAKAAIHTKRAGQEYTTPFSREIRIALTRSHISGRS